MNQVTIKQLIGHGQFFSKTLLTADAFVRYCEARGIRVSLQQLERYEELGIFLPLARLRHQKIKIKIELREDGNRYSLGKLEDGEDWAGETEEKYGSFLWSEDAVEALVESGFLWSPTLEKFEPWKTFKDENRWNAVDSYYSIFQTMPLHMLQQSTTFKIGIESVATWTQEDVKRWFRSVKKPAKRMVEISRKSSGARDELAALCQVLSSRYLPYAEKYEGMISLPHPDFLDWRKYRQSWSAHGVLEELNLNIEEVVRFHQLAEMEASSDDPLSNWSDLVKFVRRDKKEKLKGLGLLGQSWRVMERIISLFHRDLTGKELYGREDDVETTELFFGEGVPQDNLRFLEFVANQYGVNPRPKLVLYVEGDGEVQQFPRLAAELFGIIFSEIRIFIQNLGGVGEFEGEKKKDSYGAFEKLIEYYHDKQTIAFFILDKEGRVEQIKRKLISKASKNHPYRTVTKDEYIKLWDKNVEFDNFTDKEIAEAMTKLCEGRYSFAEAEVADCRSRFGKPKQGDTLSRVYKDKLNYGSNKIKLLGILIEYATSSPEMELNGARVTRPLVETIDFICDLAIRNHQPSSLETWNKTQNSEWLGNKIKPNEELENGVSKRGPS
jgi:hypothetical protein